MVTLRDNILKLLEELDDMELNLNSYHDDSSYISLMNGMVSARLRALAGYLRQLKMPDLLEVVLALDPEDRIVETLETIRVYVIPEVTRRLDVGVALPFAHGISPSLIPSDALSRIWGDGHVRVFLSHKANFKKETSKLKEALARCGISSFVAHEDIEPTEEWLREIERALFSMDALVALLTEDYHDSYWTDQELGVAMGRGVPLISIRLGRDPYGLMGKKQGVGGCDWTDPEGMAAKIFEVLYKRLPDKSRLFEAALSAYASSKSYADSGWNVKHLLAKFETLTEGQVQQVMAAYKENDQNRLSFAGKGSLMPLLEKWAGKKREVIDNELAPASDAKPVEEEVL